MGVTTNLLEKESKNKGWLGKLKLDLGKGPKARPYALNLGKRTRDRQLALEQELARLRIVFKMTAAMNATLNYERVLGMALDLVEEALTDPNDTNSRPHSAVLFFEKDELRVESARGFSIADRRARLPGQEGILRQALDTGEISISYDPAHDPELQRLTAMQVARVAMCIPLISGLKVYGILIFAHRRQEAFTPECMRLLETVAQQVMIALQNARLYSELAEEKERIMEIQEEARHKLARDLHDGPTQSISAIAMRINFIRKLMEHDPSQASGELERVETLALRTTKEIRQMLFTLRPLVLESQGLKAALEQLAEKQKEAFSQKVLVEMDGAVEDALELNRKGVIFFIIEEAVNNARKHAHSEFINVRLFKDDDVIIVNIEDNGCGFDLRAVNANYDERGSLGMINLRERTELINSLLTIDSQLGTGTRVCVTVPLTNDAAEALHRPGYAA